MPLCSISQSNLTPRFATAGMAYAILCLHFGFLFAQSSSDKSWVNFSMWSLYHISCALHSCTIHMLAAIFRCFWSYLSSICFKGCAMTSPLHIQVFEFLINMYSISIETVNVNVMPLLRLYIATYCVAHHQWAASFISSYSVSLWSVVSRLCPHEADRAAA